jgi:hypothetical protein
MAAVQQEALTLGPDHQQQQQQHILQNIYDQT